MSSSIYWTCLRRNELETLGLTEAGRDHIAQLFRQATREFITVHRELTTKEMIDALLHFEFSGDAMSQQGEDV